MSDAIRPFLRRTVRSTIDTDTEDLERRLIEAGRRLLSYFARRTENRQDAEDLLGEVMTVAWRRRSAVPTEPTAMLMWLFGVARNVLATHRRSTQRARQLRERIARETPAPALEPPLDSRIEALNGALQTLKPQDRDLVTLIHWDGFSITEAAQILRLQPGTARSRYQRLRIALRRHLADPNQT